MSTDAHPSLASGQDCRKGASGHRAFYCRAPRLSTVAAKLHRLSYRFPILLGPAAYRDTGPLDAASHCVAP